MSQYYKLSLIRLLDLITETHDKTNTFCVNNYNITLKDITDFLNDEDFLIKNNKSDYEKTVYDILFAIHNPEYINDGSIMLYLDKHQQICVKSGIEKIIAAFYYKDNFIIAMCCFNHDNLPFEAICYDNVNSIDYSMINLLPCNDTTIKQDFLNEYLNYDFLDFVKSNDDLLSETWHNRQYVIEQVKNDNVDIKDLISQDMLDDKQFILELVNINYHLIDHFYDFLDGDFQSIFLYIFEKLTDEDYSKFSYYLGETLHKYIHYFIANKKNPEDTSVIQNFTDQQQQVVNFIMREDLLVFILGNSVISTNFNSVIYAFIDIIPDYIWENDKIALESFHNFSCKRLDKLNISFFENMENVALLFHTIGRYWFKRQDWVYQYIQDFFNQKHYSYITWFKDKNNALTMLKHYNSIDCISGYVYSHLPVATIIYNILDNDLKKDLDILYELVLLSPYIFLLFDKNMQQDDKLIVYYLTHAQLSKTNCPVTKDYFFSLKQPNLIIKIINTFPELLFDVDCPIDWKHNIEHYKNQAMSMFSYFPEDIKQKLCQNEEFIIQSIKNDYSLYYHLPLYLKRNKEIILMCVKNRKFDISIIPPSVLLNSNFCIDIFLLNPHVLNNISFKIKHSIDFILSIYQKFDQSLKNNSYTELYDEINTYYPEIKLLLNYYKIKEEDTYSFLYSHFVKQKKYCLQQKLQAKYDQQSIIKEKINKI